MRSVVGMGGQYLGRLGRERGARLIPLESFDTDDVAAWLWDDLLEQDFGTSEEHREAVLSN